MRVLNFIKLFTIASFIGLVYCCFDWYKINQQIKLLEKTSARTEYLINEGYSYEAAKHITNVEFGIIPADEEYKALMED